MNEEILNLAKKDSAKIDPPCKHYEITFANSLEETIPGVMLNDQTFIQPGEIGAIVALPGSGKTHTCEAIAAAAIAKKSNLSCDGLGFTFPQMEGDIYMQDTERPENDNIRSYHRIAKRLNWEKYEGRISHLKYEVVSEETDLTKKRELLESTLQNGSYTLVIIDGILDYSPSLNDEITAKETIVWLRSLAVRYKVSVIVTIHPNKGTETIAGHLGAFLYRYCRGMVLIRPNENDKNVREITTDFPQGKLSHGDLFGMRPSYFSWDDNKKLMTSTSEPEKLKRRYNAEAMKQAFYSFQSAEVSSKDLKIKYSELADIQERTAKDHLSDAVRDGILGRIGTGGPGTRYVMSTSPLI